MNHQVIHVKTVIIGAGMAGIAASINLLENNYNDFLVFEALERIGGRVCPNASRTDRIVGLRFTEAAKELKQGDKFMEITIPFIALRVQNNV